MEESLLMSLLPGLNGAVVGVTKNEYLHSILVYDLNAVEASFDSASEMAEWLNEHISALPEHVQPVLIRLNPDLTSILNERASRPH